MLRHSIEFSNDSFTYDWSIVTLNFLLFFLFFRQFDSFELNDQINISSSIESFERHQINFIFVNSIILSQWSNQHQIFFVFFFFRFLFRFFFSSMIVLNLWSNQHLFFNRKLWALSNQLHHTTKNLVDKQ